MPQRGVGHRRTRLHGSPFVPAYAPLGHGYVTPRTMPDPIRPPKGTQDLLPADTARWQAVEAAARRVAGRYGFGEVRTPTYEQTALYHRGVGESTDIVGKETFTFDTRGGESITLRPEGTAGVARALLTAGRFGRTAVREKVYYLSMSMFRYERPQKGRLRQHHQFGAEVFNDPSPAQDAECILLQRDFFAEIGLRDVTLLLNSLGDAESKARYRDALREHLTPKADTLSEDSRRRLETNPLRILDSKVPADKEACADTPAVADSLSDASREHIEQVRRCLDAVGQPYTMDASLVRGLDYYTETLWEFTAEGLGSQNAIGGGGRYNNLVESIGGPPTPGVGFGCGIERLLLALDAQGVEQAVETPPLTWVIGEPAAVLAKLTELRQAGEYADGDLTGRSEKAQRKLAAKHGAAQIIEA